MRSLKVVLFVLLVSLFVVSVSYSGGWNQDEPNYGNGEQFHAADLLIARPLGVLASAAGTAIFLVSLPFTIPTGSVDRAAQIFIVNPLKFSFSREFPDRDLSVPESDD